MSGYPHQCIDPSSNSNLDFLAIHFFIIKYYTVEIHHKDCNFQNAELKRLILFNWIRNYPDLSGAWAKLPYLMNWRLLVINLCNTAYIKSEKSTVFSAVFQRF